MPQAETCNGIDDNCDGVIDNGNFPQTGQTCICPRPDPGADRRAGSTCKAGHLVCRGTMGFVCEGCVLPTPEVCDGKDNNCDGMTDTAAQCPSGFGCRDGAVHPAVHGRRVPLPARIQVREQFCVPQRCPGHHLPDAARSATRTPAPASTCARASICAGPQTCVAGPLRRLQRPAARLHGAGRSASAAAARPTRAWASPAPTASTATTAPASTSASRASAATASAAWRATASPTLLRPCPAPTGQFCNPLTREVRDRPLPRRPSAAPGMALRPADQHLQGRSLPDHRLPRGLLDLQVTPDGIGTCIVDNDKCQPVTSTSARRAAATAAAARSAADGASPLALLLGLALVCAPPPASLARQLSLVMPGVDGGGRARALRRRSPAGRRRVVIVILPRRDRRSPAAVPYPTAGSPRAAAGTSWPPGSRGGRASLPGRADLPLAARPGGRDRRRR